MTAEKTRMGLGWRVYGLGVMALGVACLAFGDFDPGQPVPENFPARSALAYAAGAFRSSRPLPSSGAEPRPGAPRRSPSTTRSLSSS